MLPSCGLWQHFQDLGHSFSLYGPPSRQITYNYSLLLYSLLEDRRTIDVIIAFILHLCFKMAESFENLDNILRDWAKDKVQKGVILSPRVPLFCSYHIFTSSVIYY